MLFGDQNPPDKRDLVEGKLVQLGMRVAELGSNVVFDFGFWGKDERSALRWIARAVGGRSQVVYLPIDHEEQQRRVTNRFATTPNRTFHMSDVELEQWRAQFQPPDEDELRGSQIPPVPPEHPTWSEWASQRWPSLPDQYAPTIDHDGESGAPAPGSAWGGPPGAPAPSHCQEALIRLLILPLGGRPGLSGAESSCRRVSIWKADVVPSRPVSALLNVLRRGQAPRATGQDP